MTKIKLTKIVLAVFAIGVASAAFANVPTQNFVDLKKYLGKWYEVSAIPQSFQAQCVKNTTAEYSSAEKGLIKVINSCDTESGERSVAEGRARVEDRKSNSKLKVTFVNFFDWIFDFGGNYWIIETSPTYSYSIVGDPTKKYAWILSRTPKMETSDLQKIERKLKSLGYDTCLIKTSIQTNGFSKRLPLCKLNSK